MANYEIDDIYDVDPVKLIIQEEYTMASRSYAARDIKDVLQKQSFFEDDEMIELLCHDLRNAISKVIGDLKHLEILVGNAKKKRREKINNV